MESERSSSGTGSVPESDPIDPRGPDGTYRWRQLSLDELVVLYETDMRPALARAGHNAHPRPPSYRQLLDAGLGGLQDALRDEWGLTLHEFFVDHVPGIEDTEEPSEGTERWGIDHQPTCEALDAWVETLDRREDIRQSTLETKCSRFRTFLSRYESLYGEAPLIDRVQDDSTEYDERDRVIKVFDQLDGELSTSASKLRYLGVVEEFYDWAMHRRGAAFNPARDIARTEFGWEREEPETPALSDYQVSRLYEAAEPGREQVTVVALCAWGLRTGEVAKLHVSQFALDDADPHIAWENRKNGPGEVSLLYGREVVEDRIDQLASRDQWNGYLFPSKVSRSGHLTDDTIRNSFKELAARTDTTVANSVAKPKMGRRWWYQAYSDAVAQVTEELAFVASEQGSSDEQVVGRHYHNPDVRRKRRREAMRRHLGEVFDGVSAAEHQ